MCGMIIKTGKEEIMLKETKNEFGPDLIRVIAMYFVLSLHFFLYNGYYLTENITSGYFVHTIIRTVFYTCVALFLLLTGYFKRKATFCKEHYIKLIPVLIAYLLISIITILFRTKYVGEEITTILWAKSVWSINQPSYAWYVNMYICLMLLVPFINAGYNALKSRTQKLIAVIICVCVTTLAYSINKIECSEELGGSFGFPFGYFSAMWPMAYYAAGMYIGEFRPKLPKPAVAFFAVVLTLSIACANYITIKTNYYSGYMVENGNILNVLLASSFFLLLYDIKIKNKYVRWFFAKVSALSLCTYLLSFCTDRYFYKYYSGQFTDFSTYFPLYMKIIPLSFLICVIISFPVNELIKLISKPIMKATIILVEKAGQIKTRKIGQE